MPPAGSVSLAGAATPGSGQDFVVNVGDRVFFETDSSEFTPTAIATLSRQVQWLRQYPRYTFVVEGHADERGTREYNIALGAKRATAVQGLPRRARHRVGPHAHDFVRQGTAGRGLRRHFLLVAEPSRGDRAQQRRRLTRKPFDYTDSDGGRFGRRFRCRRPTLAEVPRPMLVFGQAPVPVERQEATTVMKRAGLIFSGFLLATALAGAPTAGEAAWWPWSKHTDKAAPDVIAPPGTDLSATPVDATDRLSRAEQKLRVLTGQIEELNFQLQQLQEQLQRVQADSDARIQALEAAQGGAVIKQPPVAAAAPAAPQQSVLVIADQPPARAPGAAAGAVEPPGRTAIDGPRPVGQDQPIDLTGAASGPVAAAAPAAEAPAQVASLGDPAADYERAYNSILSGDYVLAAAAFQQFIATYPTDDRVADAHYWLGESLFERGQYREAADEFLAGYKGYPKSAKAPDTLLKLGLSLAGLGERDAACSTYAELLKKYPQASKSLRQRVTAEQAVASCG